jgi:hypothetical protein
LITQADEPALLDYGTGHEAACHHPRNVDDVAAMRP